jgi:hypothetical protein
VVEAWITPLARASKYMAKLGLSMVEMVGAMVKEMVGAVVNPAQANNGCR